ncbi:hypothetical protein CGLO_03555 [Colletotrichum gloeosporioides Cg-14]|uniref:Geranylgeranyl pyrophosphate synthetase n=1 Tax=Colletotrichum gloeosporioides (strain Cg-14) TaxID=1237896 RepID=T0M6B3_COLGC|nr:hypothetical protein CGLO_03555 [Colletotrichum gloeosporioides Cg-14]
MAGSNQRKRKRDRQRRLQQQQIIDDGRSDGKSDVKNEGKNDGKKENGEYKQDCYGKDDDDIAGHSSKRLKSHHPSDHDNSQISLRTSPATDAPATKAVKNWTPVITNPAGAEINAKDCWLSRQLGHQTGSLDLRSIQDQSPDRTSISSTAGFEVVTSYNWLNKNTIMVPGAAPALIQRNLPLQINPDKGTYHVDINAFMNPTMPFEPMFRAIEADVSPPTFYSVDVVVNRNSLRQLFNFVKGGKKDSFRVQLHMVRNTLFITRQEKNNQYSMGYGKSYSFGHSFEEEFTEHAKDMKGSLSHHRAIRYQFGDLNLVVRHEVDAAQPAPAAPPTLAGDLAAVEGKAMKEVNVSSVNDAREFQPVRDHRSYIGISKKKRQKTTVPQCGTGNPPSDLVEMKARPKLRLSEVIDQMWFGRTTHLVNGIHEGGEFSAIKRVNCELLFQQWEQQRQNDLSRLESLLSLLRREVSAGKGNSLVAVCRQDNNSVLEFWTSSFPETPLPSELIDKFWSTETRDAGEKAVSDPMGLIHQDLEVEVGKSVVSNESTKIDDTLKVCQLQPKRRRRLPWQRV